MGRLPGKTETITLKDFNEAFFKTLKHGQILGFKQDDGSMKHWRVSKVIHKDCYARLHPWELYDDLEGVEEAREQSKKND